MPVKNASDLEQKIDLLADKLVEMKDQYETAKTVVREFEKVRIDLLASVDEFGLSPDQTATIETDLAKVAVGQMGFSRTVNVERAVEHLGSKQFIELASVPLTKLDAIVPPEEAEMLGIIEKSRRGSRSVVVERR